MARRRFIRKRKYVRRTGRRYIRRSFRARRRFVRNAKTIRRVVRNMSEVKFVTGETERLMLGVSSGQSFHINSLWSDPGQGPGKFERIGDIIKVKRISFRLRVDVVRTGAPLINNGLVRVFLFKYRGGDYTNDWSTYTGGTWADHFLTSQATVAPFNTTNIQVLKEWTFNLTRDQNETGGRSNWYIKYSLPYPVTMKYKATAAKVKNVEDILWLGLVNTVEDAAYSINYIYSRRISFVDL